MMKIKTEICFVDTKFCLCLNYLIEASEDDDQNIIDELMEDMETSGNWPELNVDKSDDDDDMNDPSSEPQQLKHEWD